MGTRGLFGWRANGRDYLTYNHFDSYPGGLGVDMLNHARTINEAGVGAAAEAVARLTEVDDQAPPTEDQAAELRARGIEGPENVSTRADWYAWLRSTQGDPDAVLRVGYYADSRGFADDSLFCEWGYVVNLDDRTLEVYEGFQKVQGTGRYAEAATEPDEGGYWPITLVATFPLDGLPGDAAFVAALEDIDS